MALDQKCMCAIDCAGLLGIARPFGKRVILVLCQEAWVHVSHNIRNLCQLSRHLEEFTQYKNPLSTYLVSFVSFYSIISIMIHIKDKNEGIKTKTDEKESTCSIKCRIVKSKPIFQGSTNWWPPKWTKHFGTHD